MAAGWLTAMAGKPRFSCWPRSALVPHGVPALAPVAPAVAIAIGVVTVVLAIAAVLPAVAVTRLALDAPFQALDAILDIARFAVAICCAGIFVCLDPIEVFDR